MAFKLNLNLVPSNNYEDGDLKQFEKQEVSIEELLIWCTTRGASDLYVKEFEYPYISRFGKIIKIPCVPTSRDVWMEFQEKYINHQMNDTYMVNRMLDTAIEVRIPEDNPLYGKYEDYFFRYRASFGFSEDSRIGTFRMIRPEQPSFDTINYPEECKEALKKAYSNRTGIIFFTGATGSGKALHKDTIIPTLSYTCPVTIEKIKVGDIIFDEDKLPTVVIDKYSPNDERFFEFAFDNGEKVKSAGGHLWKVLVENKEKIITSEEIYDIGIDKIKIKRNRAYDNSLEEKYFIITEIKEIQDNTNDYYCLSVNSPSHMFMCTESWIPTHNTTTQVAVMNDFTKPGQILDNKVIIGMEDPIEYTFKSTESVKFNQKELEKDFLSYELGIKQSLREHPNVILVGECRDKPVINATIEAARTGHLVSTSFHASDVGGTIARLSFHLENDINLIYDLIINLNIIINYCHFFYNYVIPISTPVIVPTIHVILKLSVTSS